jgi:carbon monoxide dehydrogenase subunit G
MNVRGRSTLDAPREAVYAAICDPGALLEVIPGCQAIEQIAPDEYRGRISIRLPAIVGTYDTRVRLVETDPPAHGALEGRVEGRVGTIEGRASFQLTDDDRGTVVEYEGAGVVGGPLARLDSRFLEGFARSLIDEGLARLEKRLKAAPVEAAG